MRITEISYEQLQSLSRFDPSPAGRYENGGVSVGATVDGDDDPTAVYEELRLWVTTQLSAPPE